MNKLTFCAVTLSCISLIGDEIPQEIAVAFSQPPTILQVIDSNHYFTPKVFFKRHREGGYNYDMYGLTVGYHYQKPEGLNFKVGISSNLDGDKPYIEEDLNLSYAIVGNERLSFTPYIATKNATHQIKKLEDTKYIVTKGSLYVGTGLKPQINQNIDAEIKLGLSRDLYNVLMYSTEDKFIGRKFSNPFGFIGELSFGYKIVERFTLGLEGSFARGFKNEFHSFGGALNANWNF